MHHPTINPAYRLEILENGLVFFISEMGVEILSQRIYTELLPLCDGQRTESQIVDHLSDQFPMTQIYYALLELQKRGFLVDRHERVAPASVGFWGDAKWQQKLAPKSVRVLALGAWEMDVAAMMRQQLTAAGISESRHDPSMTLVLARDYRDPELEEINRQMLQKGLAWMLAKPAGKQVWLGPIFLPGETGCWHCLQQRLNLHYQTHQRLQFDQQYPDPIYAPAPFTPTSLQTALNLTLLELEKWFITGQGLSGEVLTMDLATLQSQRHTLTRRPQCPACGQPDFVQAALQRPIQLTPSAAKLNTSGGYRSQPPEQLLRDYGRHISPITGLFPHLEASSDAAEALHVYVAGENHARLNGLSDAAVEFLRSRSMGKGNTAEQSRASAVGEAIERYCGREPYYTEFASYRELGEQAIHPNNCMLYSPLQYQYPCDSPATKRVPMPFDPKDRLYWTPLWSLTEQRHKLLPTDYCYYRRVDPALPHYCYGDSNGCAAGTTLEEAILQGFLELVERECVAVWWYNYLLHPRVDLDSFQDAHIAALQARYRDYGREVWALDLTHDFGIPTFVALSRRVDGDVEGILMGAGSHFDPTIALTRALNEMNQFLVLVLPFEQKGMFTSGQVPMDQDVTYWYRHITLANAPYLAGQPDQKPTRLQDFNFQETGLDMAGEVRRCQQLVEQKGMEMLVLNQTAPDIGLPVVRVVVPGMRHFWDRRAAGRLYDVPVQMGWLDAPLAEEDLNPLPMLL